MKMNQQYFIRYSLEVLDENYAFHREHFAKLSSVVLSLFVKRIKKRKSHFTDERLYYLNLITQKFLLHISAIQKLLDGVTITSEEEDFRQTIVDPFSVHVLVRAIVETYLVQNYLSNRNEDSDLLDARFEIWMRYGIRQRKVQPSNEEEQRVAEADQKAIASFEEKIKNREFFARLSEKKQATFLKEINRGWKFEFEEDGFRPLSWKDLLKEAGFKQGLYENIYNLLSWHAHTQSISIMQLKNMWDDDFDEVSIRVSVSKLNMFTAFMIADVVASDPEFREAFVGLREDLKSLVDFYNLSYRGEDSVT